MDLHFIIALVAIGVSTCAITIGILAAFRIYRLEWEIERLNECLQFQVSTFPTPKEDEDEGVPVDSAQMYEDRPAFLKRQAD